MKQKVEKFVKISSPVVVGGGLIWLLTRFTDVGQVGQILANFSLKINFLIFLALLLYFSVKFFTTRLLVQTAELPLTFPLISVAFAVGELARELPIAVIFPALAIWKKKQLGGVKIIAVPFIQVTLELAAAFFFLTIFGLGDLTFFHFVGIVGILGITLFLFLAKSFLQILNFFPFLKKISSEFVVGVQGLTSFNTLSRFFILALIYQFLMGLVFYQIILAIGITDVSLKEAISIFAANFTAAVISPLPFDLGVTESTGFLILTYMGVKSEAALSVMFAHRAVVALSSWFLFGIILGLVFGEFKKFFSERT